MPSRASASTAVCGCGYSIPPHSTDIFSFFGRVARTPCSQTGLNNHWNFPSFTDLPAEEDLDEDYYCPEDEAGTYWRPSRHWCFVGEIVDTWRDVRFRVLTRSKFDESVLINFHLEDARQPMFFDWSCLQRGFTMCILGACSRTFMDGNRGIRQESALTPMVFPAGLKDVSDEMDAIQRSLSTGTIECTVCRRALESPRRCAGCTLVRYCGTECQKTDWRQRHKKLCEFSQKLRGLVTLDFSQFDGHLDWSFQVCSKSTVPPFSSLGQGQFAALAQLLLAVGENVIGSDEISSSFRRVVFLPEVILGQARLSQVFSQTTAQTFLHQRLQEFCRLQGSDPRMQNHVVDLLDLSDEQSIVQNGVFALVALSLPQWQQALGIKQISWAIETHDVMDYSECYDSPTWQRTKSDSCDDSLLVRHKHSGINAFWSDETFLVSEVAQEMAISDLTRCVVRILRAVPNRAEIVREVAAKPMPPNVITLWIREEPIMCGRFRRPLSRARSLALHEVLTDCAEHNPVLDMIGIFSRTARNEAGTSQVVSQHRDAGNSGASPVPDSDDAFSRWCSQCRQRLPGHAFSKTQRRKPDHACRCKRCVG